MKKQNKAIVRQNVDAFLNSKAAPGAGSAEEILRFWRALSGQYPALLHGARFFLGLSAGNGALERGFGCSRLTLAASCRKPKKNMDKINQKK